MSATKHKKGRIAVVEIGGVLGSNQCRPQVYGKLLEGLGNNKRYGAVLLDINSPGGGVAASQSLYHDVRRLNSRKPVVGFIRGSGTSGAYLVGCACTHLTALPGAMVGSIGVIYARPILESLMERVGVSVTVHKAGEHKDMGSMYRDDTPEEDAMFRSQLDEIHTMFIEDVARERPILMDEVASLADGAVYTGKRAVELGLLDDVGDFAHAVEMAATLGSVGPRVQSVRPPRPLLAKLTQPQMQSPLGMLEERLSMGGYLMMPTMAGGVSL